MDRSEREIVSWWAMSPLLVVVVVVGLAMGCKKESDTPATTETAQVSSTASTTNDDGWERASVAGVIREFDVKPDGSIKIVFDDGTIFCCAQPNGALSYKIDAHQVISYATKDGKSFITSIEQK